MNANLRLKNYPLPARIESVLSAADSVAAQMERHGQPAPDVIDLSPGDYAIVDRLLASMTGGEISARHVTWNGRAVVPGENTRRAAA